MKKYILIAIVAHSLLLSYTTYEEKTLIQKAHQERFKNIEEVIDLIKEAWSVLEQCHKGIALNKRVKDAFAERWRLAYMYNDSSYSTKITEQDIATIFEQFLIELNPSISYYQKHTAMSMLGGTLYQFAREPQTEFRATIELAQKLILQNLEPYFTPGIKQEVEADTDHFFKDGFRFLLFVVLKKYHKNFSSDDERFINEKIAMFLTEAGRTYPYISTMQFEAWVFALLQDLLFSECQICMHRKVDCYLSCCKTRTICSTCYANVYQCPFCRAPKV
jgi:hypothetical protein